MKTFPLFLLLLFTTCIASAQNVDKVPIYQQFPDVPAFTLTRFPDSTVIAKQDLKKKTATIIILFSPDCDHCKTATADMLANMDGLKKAQIIMVSSLDFSWIKKFNKEFNIDKYPNITLATQPNFFLFEFYSLSSFPSVFAYDKKGKLVGDFKDHVKFKEVAEAIK